MQTSIVPCNLLLSYTVAQLVVHSDGNGKLMGLDPKNADTDKPKCSAKQHKMKAYAKCIRLM